MTGALIIVGAQALLLTSAVRAAARDGIHWRAALTQIAHLGTASLPLVISGMGFFGMVMTTIAYAQARKYTGNVAVVGPAYFELIVREFAPMLVALLAASRSAAASSAELGAMAVNEQLEAMELSAADPASELVVPRVVASLISVPALTVIGTVVAAVSAALTVTFVFKEDGRAFMDPRFVEAVDVASALTKALLCGLYIPIASSLRGLRARGGAAAVGEAVTTGVVEACMGCLVIDFCVTAAFVLVDSA